MSSRKRSSNIAESPNAAFLTESVLGSSNELRNIDPAPTANDLTESVLAPSDELGNIDSDDGIP